MVDTSDVTPPMTTSDGGYITTDGNRQNNHFPESLPGPCSRDTSFDTRSRSFSSCSTTALIPMPSRPDHGGSSPGSPETVLFHRMDDDTDPLRPDPGEEHAFHVKDNPFAFSPGQLSKMFNSKSLAAFRALGGLQGLLEGLRTDGSNGLDSDETTLYDAVESGEVAIPIHTVLPNEADPSPTSRGGQSTSFQPTGHARSQLHADRRRVFGENRLPKKKPKNIFQLMWIALNDEVLIILSTVATISLALGLYQTFGQQHRKGEPRVEWVEGVTIMTAVIIVVVVGSLNDYQKERQFVKLNKKKEDRVVRAIRSGRSLEMSVYEILVGDVLHLGAGDLTPVDGVFISGHNVRCDESSVTGESNQAKKTPADEVMALIEAGVSTENLDPFIISGTKVLEGVGTYLATGVGTYSSYGRLLVAVTEESEVTPLQLKLIVVADQIAKWGVTIAVFLFFVLFVRFLTQLPGSTDTPTEKGQRFLQIVIVSVTVVVVAVPEGLPLAVTLALAFAITRMLKDNNLVRILSSCETMGNATTVCCDKTGTLTLNKMTVVAGTLSMVCRIRNPGETTCEDLFRYRQTAPKASIVSAEEFATTVSEEFRNVLLRSIIDNTTAIEGEKDGIHTFIGSKTEIALLSFAKDVLGAGPVSGERARTSVVQMIPFDSSRKWMASVTKLPEGTYRMYMKGAPEILLDKCTRVVADATKPINAINLTTDDYNAMTTIIDEYATRSLRTLGMCYRDFRSWPPSGAKMVLGNPKEDLTQDFFKKMTFLGVFGIQDPLRPGVKDAVIACQRAGVVVKMLTGDNIKTALAIAKECGIYSEGGEVMEGHAFRGLPPAKMREVVPRLQVLARSSPEDKRIIVKLLKERGEIVAVTGDGTNDGPALGTADVGFSMGISGTEVAKEASSIVLMDDNFSSIVKAIQWGRAVNDAIRKFLQFQLTVNVTAVTLTVVSAIASNKEASILTPVQLLWVNLIMDTFAALALATDPPSQGILDRKPDPRSAPLITTNMWKMIIGQSIYQLIVTLSLNFSGNRILGYTTEAQKSTLETLIFNSYVWMQFFNQFNNRRLDNHLNVLEGIYRNWYFICISLITVGGQILIIFFGGSALSAKRLDAKQWGISIFLGALSLPAGAAIRLIPDEFVRKLIDICSIARKAPPPQVNITSDDGARIEWNDILENIRNELISHKRIRSGRLSRLIPALLPKLQRRRDSLPISRPNSMASMSGENRLHTIGDNHRHPRGLSPSISRSGSSSGLAPAAAMAGLVAGSIAGWSPLE